MVLIGILFYFVILPLKSKNKLNWKDLILNLKSFIPYNKKN